MHILLTGVAGFIGSSLCERLLGRGDRVVGLDNFDETLYGKDIKQRNLSSLTSISGARFRFIEGNFLDEKLCDRLVADKPDVIVHLGALAGVRPSIEQPKRYQKVNIEGTLNLLEACRAHGVRRFVFASSSSVYGSHSRNRVEAFSESDPAVRPASPYAATKRAGELLCSNYSDLFGIATPSLRFFTVYGPRQRPEMAIHKFTRLIAGGQPVPFFGDGSTARDYTYIDDIVDGVVASIDHCETMLAAHRQGKHDEKASLHRVYNLGGSRTTTLSELVALIEAALGKKAILDEKPDQPGDVPITFADVSRAGAELNYVPRIPIEEGIARFVQWFKAGRGESSRASS